MKYLRLYEASHRDAKLQELISAFEYNRNWEPVSGAEYPDTVKAFVHKLNSNFIVKVLFRKSSQDLTTVNCYLYDVKDDSMSYLDNVEDPHITANRYLRGIGNSYGRESYNPLEIPDWCVKIAEKQMEYYKVLNKFPSEEEMNSFIEELIDFRFAKPLNEFDLIDLKFGYIDYSFPKDIWDDNVYYHKDNKSTREPLYVAYLESSTAAYDIYVKYRDEFKSGKDYCDKVKQCLTECFEIAKKKISAIYGFEANIFTSTDFDEHNLEQLQRLMDSGEYGRNYRIIITFKLK
jgi:hypothetical protein